MMIMIITGEVMDMTTITEEVTDMTTTTEEVIAREVMDTTGGLITILETELT